MSSTRVLVADANSTDGTPEIVMSFRDRLNVSVIRGGMPSVGRNQGAAQADTPYVLFVDADIELADRSLVRRCVERAQSKQLHCVTTNILCKEGSWLDKAFYAGSDVFQYLSYVHRPYATGMFMFFDRKKFWELGGFHEQILFAEDYRLSQQVDAPAVCGGAGRGLYHEPAVQEDGASAGGVVVLVDGAELLEREIFSARSQVLGGVGCGAGVAGRFLGVADFCGDCRAVLQPRRHLPSGFDRYDKVVAFEQVCEFETSFCRPQETGSSQPAGSCFCGLGR